MAAGMELINLDAGGSFVFQYYPTNATTTDRANWEPQETTIGVKPLFYANREPRQIHFPELWFDTSDTNDSVTPRVNELKALFNETSKGTPPALLAVWGDRRERCVLVELVVEEIFFHREGYPIRAKVQVTLLQLQEEGEATSVQILD